MKIYILVVTSILSSTIMANRVMPEISKDGKTRNSSSMAVANERRQFFNTQFEVNSAEIGTLDSVDASDFDIDGAFSNRDFSVEFTYNDTVGFIDSSPIQTEIGENREALVLLGYRPIDAISLGFGYRNVESDLNNSNTNRYDVESSVLYNLNRMSFGASYRYIKPNSSEHAYYSWTTLAGGYQDEVLSAETGIVLKSKNAELNRGERKEFFIGATRRYHNLEFDGDIEYEFGDSSFNSGDYKRLKTRLDVEVLLTNYFYITPGLDYRNLEVGAASSEQLYTNIDFGYRESDMDATLAIDYLADGSIEAAGQEVEIDQYRITLGMAYRF